MSAGENSALDREREYLKAAHEKGSMATLAAYVRLSGPGWLQSAITLGGGSLAGALFLGILGGTSLLWLQLVAIIMGVVMLSAISYVTLSTGERPFRSINQHINPALGWSWIIATIMANLIWCMPQFSLCFAALQKNLVGTETLGDSKFTKLMISAVILAVATMAVYLNSRQGAAAKAFDWILKVLVGTIVICFVGVVGLLTANGALDWATILKGFIPDISQWNTPTGKIAELIATLPAVQQEFWNARVVAAQQEVMIGAAATAVGINMTFLMPYSLLKRGWDKTYRGLSRFDLSTGMAIPYVLVTSCVVIATAARFHAQVDEQFLSPDPSVMQQSGLYKGAVGILAQRVILDGEVAEAEMASAIASLPAEEKIIASSLVKRQAFELATALEPLLGAQKARTAFGLGIFGMGFSTIIILMLINGFAVCELANKKLGGGVHLAGCMMAGVVGALWPLIWESESQVYLAVITSSFGMMLLPIAYITFFMMMNSKRLLGNDRPEGFARIIWNVLMVISVAGACVAAATAVKAKMADPTVGPVVIGVLVVFVVAIIAGFMFKRPDPSSAE